MADKKTGDAIDPHIEFPEHEALWGSLETLHRDPPSPTLRRDFYRSLRARSAQQEAAWRRWLAPVRTLAPIAIAVAVGIGIGRGFITDTPSSVPATAEVAALREEVGQLSRQVALSSLEHAAASERLRGIGLIASLGPDDDEATRGLLRAATSDPVAAVRGAALDALGPRLNDPTVSQRVASLLLETPSVLVQLSVADLIMRWGDDPMIEELVDAAQAQQLFPDVSRFVLERVRRKTV